MFKVQVILGGNLINVMRITAAAKTFLPVEQPVIQGAPVAFFATAEVKILFLLVIL